MPVGLSVLDIDTDIINPLNGNVITVNDIEISTNGTNNINIGEDSGQAITTGERNTSLGNLALTSSTSDVDNTAVGHQALEINQGGANTAVGSWALKVATASIQNDAFGAYSLNQFNSGSFNTAIGSNAGWTLLNGDNNTFLGFQSGSMFTSSANRNTVLGNSQGVAFTGGSGNDNVFVGRNAGRAYGGGDNNVILGSYAMSFASPITGDNNIQIGYNSTKATATTSNSITLGNSSHTVIRAAVTTITSLSDERDKDEIKDLSAGLDFINEIKPVSFVWKDRDENGKQGIKDSGFTAQNLKEVQEKYNLSEELKLVYEENPEKLEASYGRLIPILVKAIQELSDKFKELEAK